MQMQRMMVCALLALPLAGLFASTGQATETAPAQTSRSIATIVTDSDSVLAGHPLQIALRLRLAPGWHTYWHNPGDAGAPPSVDLTLPPSWSAGPITWPTPARQPEGPLMTYGYSGDVLLPETLTPAANANGAITAHATWLVCRDICVPEDASFTLSLPAGPGLPSGQASLFAEAINHTPRPAPFTAQVVRTGTTNQAQVVIDDPAFAASTIQQAWFLPDTAGQIIDTAPQPLSQRAGELRLGMTLATAPATASLSGVLVIHDAAGLESAYSLSAPLGAPTSAPETAPPALVSLLGLALLGGLILNLMPCVFPILAMKAIGLARLSGTARHQVRRHALSYAGGILVTFAALAAVTIGLRAAGVAAGWGFQFQSPVFVTLIAWLLFLVGLALSNLISFANTSWTGAGSRLTQHRGHLGSFFTGLLAVLVATPCTAPFMGAAIAGTLAAPPAITLLVFLAIGFGLAAPTLLLFALPHLAEKLPRPGRWMAILKQALAFPMYAAAIWLVWVISIESGPTGVLAVLSGMLALSLGAWAYHVSAGRRLGSAFAGLAALAALAILLGVANQPAAAPQTARADGAEPFTPARLAALRTEGRPVFVNLTAAWCVTCQINERLALSPAAVHEAFAQHHVAYLVGDWTRQDPSITHYLHDQDRDGVPLYLYYPPGGGPPTVLPQILTEATVLRQIQGG
jgi:thiol:disulfide interchange protein DsbD